MAATLLPLIAGFLLVLALGAALRATKRLTPDGTAALNALILDVTTPALVLHVLATSAFDAAALAVLPPAIVGLAAGMVAAWIAARALGASPPTIGAALLCGGFGNTGFLGLPVLFALFPGDGLAVAAALLVNLVLNNLILWLVAPSVARAFGGGAAPSLRERLAPLVHPTTLAMVLGLGLQAARGAFGFSLPPFLLDVLAPLGAATLPLVFLSLGSTLQPPRRGQATLALLVSAAKLVVAPAAALAGALLLDRWGFDVPARVASIAALQSAMPSAMVVVVVASRYRCDGAFAAVATSVSTVLAALTLPAAGRLLDQLRW
jgi:hypothetical protein